MQGTRLKFAVLLAGVAAVLGGLASTAEARTGAGTGQTVAASLLVGFL